MPRSYSISAHWDPEAAVWYSRSDIPGLVIEADTFAEFAQLADAFGPEMLAANAVAIGEGDVIAVRVDRP